MFIDDNRRSTHGMIIEDCTRGTIVEIEDRDGFYIVVGPSIDEFLNSDEFEEDIENYTFIIDCANGEFDAIGNDTWCYPLNAKLIIEQVERPIFILVVLQLNFNKKIIPCGNYFTRKIIINPIVIAVKAISRTLFEDGR